MSNSPAATLDHGLATHPHVRLDGNLLLDNPFYEPPHEAAQRSSDGGSLPGKLDLLKNALAALVGGNKEPVPGVAFVRH